MSFNQVGRLSCSLGELKEEAKMKRRRKRKEIVKEIDSEDWCFVCKDGGKLIICEYKDCLKVYHSDCVGTNGSASETKELWTCNWHYCLMCHNNATFHCFCCPSSICECCINVAEFAPVRRRMGFCDECLSLIRLVEDDVDYDPDMGQIDFQDRNTYECLFREYWEIIKEKEGLTLKDVCSADTLLKQKKRKCASNSAKIAKAEEDDEYIRSDCETDVEVEAMGRKKHFQSLEFIGWGSKPLIDFLSSIGKDTTEQLSQHDVDSIISKYIREKRLFHPEKKRKVICDDKLYSVFKRKLLHKNRIYSLLEAHFAENSLPLEDDEGEEENRNVSVDKDENIGEACKKQKGSYPDSRAEEKEKNAPVIQHIRYSDYASFVVDNVKLVYLRRSLVEELLKKPESFESKIVGSFVRVKTDPKDYLQKNSHQLLQVAGVKKSATGVLLQVTNMHNEIHISMLSDLDFTQEECEDLQRKVNDGLLRRPTVGELEKKAINLHEDITKHWIERELITLQNYIDKANEKGRRKELFEYIEQRERLKKPSEQERLIKQMPKVIVDIVELVAVDSELFDISDNTVND